MLYIFIGEKCVFTSLSDQRRGARWGESSARGVTPYRENGKADGGGGGGGSCANVFGWKDDDDDDDDDDDG